MEALFGGRGGDTGRFHSHSAGPEAATKESG